jgi:hypothetical protein
MSRHSPAVMPADFSTVALNLSQQQAASHYGLSVWQVIRMMREMPPEWRDEYKRGWAVRSRAAALANLAAAKAKGFNLSGGRKYLPRPMPEGFLAFMLNNSADAGCKEWKTSEATIKRWKTQLTEAERNAIASNAKARKTAHIKAMTARRKANTPPKPPHKKPPRARGFGFNKLPEITAFPGGVVAMAAQFLRIKERHVAPIVSATVVLGKAGAGFYKYGTKLVPEAFIVERAKAAGWDADVARMVA